MLGFNDTRVHLASDGGDYVSLYSELDAGGTAMIPHDEDLGIRAAR